MLCFAFHYRCLVEGAGDVAFIKHTIVPENSNGKTLTLTRFHLSCDCVVLYETTTSFYLFLSKATVQHGLVLWGLKNTSWSAPERLQCQSVNTNLVTWLWCLHTLWWLARRAAVPWSALSRTSRSVVVTGIRNTYVFAPLYQILYMCVFAGQFCGTMK